MTVQSKLNTLDLTFTAFARFLRNTVVFLFKTTPAALFDQYGRVNTHTSQVCMKTKGSSIIRVKEGRITQGQSRGTGSRSEPGLLFGMIWIFWFKAPTKDLCNLRVDARQTLLSLRWRMETTHVEHVHNMKTQYIPKPSETLRQGHYRIKYKELWCILYSHRSLQSNYRGTYTHTHRGTGCNILCQSSKWN